MRKPYLLCGIILLVFLASCTPTPTPPTITPTPSFTSPPSATASPDLSLTPTLPVTETITPVPRFTETPTLTPISAVRFAVIGDYGEASNPERDVAAMIDSWQVDFIITVGDNNYPDGATSTMDRNVGQYYHAYIYPYTGGYGEGSDINRFFPTLGNHDWTPPGGQPYLEYFTLPGNERYYDFQWGEVHLFAVDSDEREPDGFRRDSIQANWLRDSLASSEATWKIVYFHHAPYSSGFHGSTTWLRWPFQDWGASAVLSGHDHTYERVLVDGFPYFVNGLGGSSRYTFGIPIEGSQVRYNADFGAMLIEASAESITFQFVNRAGTLIDTYTLTAGN